MIGSPPAFAYSRAIPPGARFHVDFISRLRSRPVRGERRRKRRALAAKVDAICRDTGFLAIANHGVPQAIIDGVWSKARAFFDLPTRRRSGQRRLTPGYPYGYLGPELESLAKSRNVDSPPDLKESFNGGPLRRAGRHDRPGSPGVLLRRDDLARGAGWLRRGVAAPIIPRLRISPRGSCAPSPPRSHCTRTTSRGTSTRP